MTLLQILALVPLLRLFLPAEISPLLEALVNGSEQVAARIAGDIARSRAIGMAAGRAAAASSRATERQRVRK